MDFLSLSRLNVFVNTVSGNMLPVTSEKTKSTIPLKIYWLVVWAIQLSYLTMCILGVRYVPTEKALKDSTVAILVTLETIALSTYLNSRQDPLRQLIRQLNDALSKGDELLGGITTATVKPLERLLKVYTIGSIGPVSAWTFLKIIEVFRKDEFRYVDYRVPVVLSSEPFSTNVFVAGVIFVCLGSTYAIAKKVSLDLYMIHLVRLMTAQYRYLRMKFAAILRQDGGTSNSSMDDVWRSVGWEEERKVKQEIRLLACHYETELLEYLSSLITTTVCRMSVTLKHLLAPNIGVLYINNVFRFCFLSIMLVMTSTEDMEKYLIILYTIGALIQLYTLCFSIQELFEASKAVADDAFYEKWCVYDASLRRMTSVMIFGNKLECKLSSLRSIDLTLPSFMSILNQAYSVCLLFLKAG